MQNTSLAHSASVAAVRYMNVGDGDAHHPSNCVARRYAMRSSVRKEHCSDGSLHGEHNLTLEMIPDIRRAPVPTADINNAQDNITTVLERFGNANEVRRCARKWRTRSRVGWIHRCRHCTPRPEHRRGTSTQTSLFWTSQENGSITSHCPVTIESFLRFICSNASTFFIAFFVLFLST